jgi:hypothetical protein
MFYRLKMITYGHVKRALKQKIAKLVAEGELASENSDEEQHMYPVVLSTKASTEIYEERDRIN